MADAHFDAELIVNMLSKMLGGIDGAMLSSCAAEAEHQTGKASLDVALYVGIGQLIDAVEERQYLAVVLEETDDGLIESCHLLVLLVTPWVVGAAAVEHVASAIAALVLRNTFLIGETEDADNEWRVLVADD